MTDTRPAVRGGAALALPLAVLALASARAEQPTPPPPVPAPQERSVPNVASTAASRADPVTRWQSFIDEASRRFGVPTAWIARVMRAESGGLIRLKGRPITSSAGAMGVMQLMPATWAEMRARYGLGTDPFNPRDNILAGTAFLAELHARFGYPGLFGAYNAGPARYADWLAGRRTLPAETRLYLARVAPAAAPGGPSEEARSAAALVAAPSARQAFCGRSNPGPEPWRGRNANSKRVVRAAREWPNVAIRRPLECTFPAQFPPVEKTKQWRLKPLGRGRRKGGSGP